jgi:hypothetical protein
MVDTFGFVAALIVVFLAGYGVAWLTLLRGHEGGPSLHEIVTHIVGASVLGFAGAVMYSAFGDPAGTQRAQDIWSLLGPLAGGVLGYYFSTTQSARVVRQSTERAAGAELARDDMKAESSIKFDDLNDRVDEALSVVHSMRDALATAAQEDDVGDEEDDEEGSVPAGPAGAAEPPR